MNGFLQYLISRLDDHLSDECMARLLCRELPFTERLIATQHLAKCWHCRARREDLEGRRANQMIRLYREALEHEELSFDLRPREEFQQRLRSQMQDALPRRRWFIRLPQMTRRDLSPMKPAMAIGMALGVVGTVCFFFLWQQRLPHITSNALLARAERWDMPGSSTSGDIVFQKVRITTPHQTMERSIYRDIRGKRKPRQMKLDAKEDQLRSKLVEAGFDWDKPISATSYQDWHDHQHVREDKIVRSDGHLLTLTTKVPDGSIVEQSLTVRDTDFHPVRRTVAFRDSETVDIAELDFKILPWNGVDANLFDFGSSTETAARTAPARVLSLPRIPETPTEGQLEEIELGARLVLNQLHADTGQQIEINRTSQRVEVKGLVDTDDLKQALQTQLRILPHLIVSIQSVADLKNSLGAANDNVAGDIRMASMPDQPSPLETYLLSKGRSVRDINVLARRLYESALTISQESKAISDLQARFVAGEQKSVMASATLSDLIYSHRERLLVALQHERELLALVQVPSAMEERGSEPRPSLIRASFRNMAFCRELTQNNSPVMRSADKIFADMAISVADLTDDVRDLYLKAHPVDSAEDGGR